MNGKGPKTPRFTRTKTHIEFRYFRYTVRIVPLPGKKYNFQVKFRGRLLWSYTTEDEINYTMEVIETIYENEKHAD